jgi:hypothetical protein
MIQLSCPSAINRIAILALENMASDHRYILNQPPLTALAFVAAIDDHDRAMFLSPRFAGEIRARRKKSKFSLQGSGERNGAYAARAGIALTRFSIPDIALCHAISLGWKGMNYGVFRA